MPICWIIAGPNGAGKTTYALKYLPEVANCRNFINADLIAAGLSPLAPEREQMAANRIFLREIKANIGRHGDFAFETTLSGRTYLRLVNGLIETGWQVELVYLALPNVKMSQMRVAERVAHGGHNIPAHAIERRFPRSLYNLLVDYSSLVSRTRCFMNHQEYPELVFEQVGDEREIIHTEFYRRLLKEGGL
ncbi:MAG: c [Gammaproteobacteria bacterium (ex Lamellibrachia satsuma)]|nr:MAG: hypothetical protein HPY30_16300 [Gammaproteobacteria bacterium (ex Lamellibrachia satsuma)]RRS31641.1 MAG: c [Gammaproteobacteria bacterium (ex Lamellibrachia satsuma)] [Gammaproteobacteria bacterium (ex Lamellibrachia satsuma)]RRS36132.1 MAG: c [Gammaproteobacteria bacterium (ex Lamellibrachia satsuma)] [Gammaproteobacteria bacterium (ex Lamellibrachia satsuma)]